MAAILKMMIIVPYNKYAALFSPLKTFWQVNGHWLCYPWAIVEKKRQSFKASEKEELLEGKKDVYLAVVKNYDDKIIIISIISKENKNWIFKGLKEIFWQQKNSTDLSFLTSFQNHISSPDIPPRSFRLFKSFLPFRKNQSCHLLLMIFILQNYCFRRTQQQKK